MKNKTNVGFVSAVWTLAVLSVVESTVKPPRRAKTMRILRNAALAITSCTVLGVNIAIAEVVTFSGTVLADQGIHPISGEIVDIFASAIEVEDIAFFQLSFDLSSAPQDGFDFADRLRLRDPDVTGSWVTYDLSGLGLGELQVDIGTASYTCDLVQLVVLNDFSSPLFGFPEPFDLWSVSAAEGTASLDCLVPDSQFSSLIFNIGLLNSDAAVLADDSPVLPDSLEGFVGSFRASATEVIISPEGTANLILMTVGDGTIDAINDFLAEVLLEDLISAVVGLDLSAGIGGALDRQLQNALDRAQANDNPSASGIIYALIQSVEAQRGKKLTDEQANDIVASAEAIIAALEAQ